MGSRYVIDPITRIEGHLRVEIEVENGVIKDAWSSGTMWRGFEVFLRDRDPRDAWIITQRVCGVCTTVHALASVKAVENAVGVQIPDNARIIRNLIMGAQQLHDHIVHFYHLHALDWVDVVSALSASPKKTSDLANSVNPNAPNSGPGDFLTVQEKLKKFVKGGQLGPFTNGYWGHPKMKLPPEANLMAVAHYLQALKVQSDVAVMHAVFGAKNPHIQTYAVGGVTCVNDLDPDRIAVFKARLDETKSFIENVFIPDILAIAPFYLDWAGIGGGLENYLSYGMMPENVTGSEPDNLWYPRGIVIGRDMTRVYPVDIDKITEDVTNSWYKYKDGEPLHPSVGETDPHYTGLDTASKYSWLKTPRYDGIACEVGPLSRMIVNYAAGHSETVSAVNHLLGALNAKPDALFSTLGRTAARAIESKIVVDKCYDYLDQLIANLRRGDYSVFTESTIPRQAHGFGLTEAPRGALGHWIEIADRKIKNYQLVVPTTWNGSPRDKDGVRSAFEASLIGTPISNPKEPLEVLRTIHSFDPCLACSVHVIDLDRGDSYEVKVVE